ncbi:pyridoxal 5'-phosphate synthase [Agrobacterium sp. V1]|uniref:pyridoxine/pyridoxamine 5'-phosphate oxidase n=1 Tax=Agrobacterium sp. V1 TaxID=3061957 RepID=UPI0026716BE4|nr:pyridoxal 5'-phosphate synthase [Agrobacterium sp. V1]MDO3444881.1 pyridoxal 5'-phosphate synthase [Agrobacterium sp. V1]
MTCSEAIALSMKDRLRQIPSLKAPLPECDPLALPDTPQDAFALWLDDALNAGIREPHAMTLSTVDENGWPDARMLILKNLDERGWHFAVKAESPKGRQIENRSYVALTFYWSALGRQVRLRGPAIMLSDSECAEDFLDRPASSRASAIASRQSEILEAGEGLESRMAEAQALIAANPDYVSPGWRFYAVAPVVAEFWQGASDRNHKRLRYVLSGDSATWDRSLLWP